MRRVLEESKREYEQLQALQKAAAGDADEEEKAPPKKEAPKAEPKPKAVPKKEAPKPAPPKEEPKPEPIKAPKKLAPLGDAKPAPAAKDFDIKKHAAETAKLEEKKKEAIKKKAVSPLP